MPTPRKKFPSAPRAKSPAHADLESVLLTPAAIKRRVRVLGAQISKTYGKNEITIVPIINGSIFFTADLLRHLANPIRLDCMRIFSYRNSAKSHGKPKLLHSLTLDIEGSHVLVIDDILDTGKTLSAVVSLLKKRNPASLRTCVLLDKKSRRQVEFKADFTGFEIPDKFVVGYGLDYAERYRGLPCIGVLKPENISSA